jgi:hypothetical protein
MSQAETNNQDEYNHIIDISRHRVKSVVSKLENRIEMQWLRDHSHADTAITLQLENLILTYGLEKIINVLKSQGVLK